MQAGSDILEKFRNRWQIAGYAEGLCYALGTGAGLFILGVGTWIALPAAILLLAICLSILRPWARDLGSASAYIDSKLPDAAYSSSLLLPCQAQLSGLARLQQYRVARQLAGPVQKLRTPNRLPLAAGTLVLLVLGTLAARNYGFSLSPGSENPLNPVEERITFTPVDSLPPEYIPPELTNVEVRLYFPAYTQMAATRTEDPNIRAVAGTQINWVLRFSGPVERVVLEQNGGQLPLRASGEDFGIRQSLDLSGFYSFRFSDSLGNAYTSDLYALEAIPDQVPSAEIEGVPQYSYFEPGDPGKLPITGRVADDFGIDRAYIVATVSKGTGESVKFREEQMEFDAPLPPGTREHTLPKTIDLESLGMEAGDELYYYVEAVDYRTPVPNRGRSATYFAVIRDTAAAGFAVEGTMGVDLMPDYFRSQRQLIIDTEELISEKPALAEKDFKFRSNELGFDQKALRIKYGQFMGEETEMGLEPEGADVQPSATAETEAAGVSEDGETTDPLAEYTHDHDGSNEHNLVVDKGHTEEGQIEEEDPLHAYLHNHEDPEASTLFEESLRTKLRKALDIMWDAELQLRLYQPEKSLPYQYGALELIQEIKNSARIYVHRIGFDPPPIKEDKRLTGDVDQVGNATRDANTTYEGTFPAMRQATARLEAILEGASEFTKTDRELFRKAGDELAAKAVEEPGLYLGTLRRIRGLETISGRSRNQLESLRSGLLQALPPTEQLPATRSGYRDELNSLFLKSLGDNE